MEDFILNFEEAIDSVEPGTIKPETPFKDLGYWDSLSLLSLLAMVDIRYNKQISVEEIEKCKSIQDLYNVVNQ